MKWSIADYEYMARALRLARHGIHTTQPNPRVGSVIVKDSRIIGEGWHIKAGEDHAEIIALRQAGSLADGATCYVTLEPCAHTGKTPPCTDALIASGITRVVAAMTDPNPKVAGKGLAILNNAGLTATAGLLDTQAFQLNPGFSKRMNTAMPYVRCKLAMSLDGKIALSSGISQWITGEHARSDVQRLRAQSCAILTGSGTVLADDPKLTVREVNIGNRKPIRVIADRRLRTPADAAIFQQAGKIILLTQNPDAERQSPLRNAGAEVVVIQEQDFIRSGLHYLAKNEQVNEVLVEAGATLAGSLIEQGLVDELIIYQAPVILGSHARSLLVLPDIISMSDSLTVTLMETRHVGTDIRFTYQINKNGST